MMVLPPTLHIKKASQQKLVHDLVPALKWPSLDSAFSRVDLPRFPSYQEELWRHGLGEFSFWSEDFISAVRNAASRVWLIDCYLLKADERAARSFAKIFDRVFRQTYAQDIRLLTSSKDVHQEQIRSLRDLQDARRAPPRNEPFTIEVRFVREGRSNARLPHDRFALIDDELWHWGANVGGTHHEINAFSRGWSTNDTSATEYFTRLWNAAEVSL